jgi:hypothetical protein
MTDSEFDDIFKKQLQEYEGDIPADMWQRIVADKPKRSAVYRLLYLMLFLMLVAFITGIYKFYITGNKKINNSNIVANTKNKMQSLNIFHDTSNKNELVIPAGKNGNGFNTLSKNLTAHTTYHKPQVEQQQLIEKDGYQSFAKNFAFDSIQVTSGIGLSNNITLDNATMPVQKNSNSTQIKTSDSADENAVKNDDNDKLSLQLFVSPDMPFNNIQSSNKDYEKLLQNAVNMKLSYTLGVGISVPLTPKISLATGVQYTHVNEKISFEDSALGKHSNINHFNFINVPLTINYKTGWTTAFQTSLKAGVLVNISSNYKGVMPDAFGELTDISHNVYEKNTGASIYTAINFSKTLNGKLDIFAEPYYRWQTKNIADNLQPFTRKINTVGLALGIQLKFYKADTK